MSMTALKNGKPFGTAHFQPGQGTVTFNPDATWVMKPPSPHEAGLSGSYSVHGHEVDVKLTNGNYYQDYRYAVEQGGKVLTLTTKQFIITASRE